MRNPSTAAEYDTKAEVSFFVGSKLSSADKYASATSRHATSKRYTTFATAITLAVVLLNLSMIMTARTPAIGMQRDHGTDEETVLPMIRTSSRRRLIEATESQHEFAFEFVTRNATVKQDPGKSFIVLTGLIGDMSEIRNQTLSQLIQLNCEHRVAIHILAMTITNDEIIQQQRAKFDKCASFTILKQHDKVKTMFSNRIDRIAHLRDAQRDALRRQFVDEPLEKMNLEQSAVIVMDLDLYQIPTNDEILNEAHLLMNDEDSADVVCAAGLMFHPFGYYDMFATVLPPSTFVYPLNGRLKQEYRKTDNRTLVRSNNDYGAFSLIDMWGYLQEQAALDPRGHVPVRSCFGGMAVYRASTWFLPSCRYNYDTVDMMDFANAADRRPCEHVVFHECLNNEDLSTVLAIKPSLQPLREPALPDKNELTSGQKPMDDRVITFSKYPQKSTSLVNGEYTLIIGKDGILAVRKTSSNKVVWKASLVTRLFHNNWDLMFMMLQSNGQLALKQQIKVENLRPDVPKDQIDYFDDNDDSICRIIVWRSGYKTRAGGYYKLQLTNSGEIIVYERISGKIVWSSRDGSLPKRKKIPVSEAGDASDTESEGACIPSGDETAINEALRVPGATVDLCPGSIFRIKNPIIMAEGSQTLRTQDRNSVSTSERATIIVDDPHVATAISMSGVSKALLKNVIIDGNRRKLGFIPLQKYVGGLIDAGGINARGQHIIGVKAFDPRTWTILRVMPGNPGERCKGIVIENNEFAPAGSRIHRADGISYACKDGIIKGNLIEDATDAGISLIGAVRTTVEDNTIKAISKRMHAGISISSAGSFGGSFTDTVVKNNVIVGKSAMIDVGIAMGSQVDHCHASDDGNVPIHGASVTNNTLSGDLMGYGYAISGVRDWKVLDNKDFAKHNRIPSVPCNGRLPSAPNGFQIDHTTSEGIFQSEFTGASLSGIGVNLNRAVRQKSKTAELEYAETTPAASKSITLEEQVL